MMFIVGPRQIGKTTLSLSLKHTGAYCVYLNWDDAQDQILILKGMQTLLEEKNLFVSRSQKPILILDEIHKFKNWRELKSRRIELVVS